MFKSEIKKLELGQSVEFTHNDFIYEIFPSDCEVGYVVNVYPAGTIKDEEGDLPDESIVDGGLCTGSAEDAVYFMMPVPAISSEDYNMICSENKHLADFIKSLGYSDEQVSIIASGGEL